MKQLFTVLCLLLSAVFPCLSQPADSAHFRIGMQSAAGYGCFREQGASPLTYRGAEIIPALSFAAEWGLWRADGQLMMTAGAYASRADGFGIRAFGVQPQARVGLWRHCAGSGAWNFYGGAAVSELFDARIFTQLENSRVGMSNMVLLSLHARAERDLGRWRLHGTLGFVPVALMLRPGYSFISNFDRTPDSPVASAFDQYHSYLTSACGLESELGATLMLRNGNRIEFAYRWHHLTSRTSAECPGRLDLASHTLCTNFIFQLR